MACSASQGIHPAVPLVRRVMVAPQGHPQPLCFAPSRCALVHHPTSPPAHGTGSTPSPVGIGVVQEDEPHGAAPGAGGEGQELPPPPPSALCMLSLCPPSAHTQIADKLRFVLSFKDCLLFTGCGVTSPPSHATTGPTLRTAPPPPPSLLLGQGAAPHSCCSNGSGGLQGGAPIAGAGAGGGPVVGHDTTMWLASPCVSTVLWGEVTRAAPSAAPAPLGVGGFGLCPTGPPLPPPASSGGEPRGEAAPQKYVLVLF